MGLDRRISTAAPRTPHCAPLASSSPSPWQPPMFSSSPRFHLSQSVTSGSHAVCSVLRPAPRSAAPAAARAACWVCTGPLTRVSGGGSHLGARPGHLLTRTGAWRCQQLPPRWGCRPPGTRGEPRRSPRSVLGLTSDGGSLGGQSCCARVTEGVSEDTPGREGRGRCPSGTSGSETPRGPLSRKVQRDALETESEPRSTCVCAERAAFLRGRPACDGRRGPGVAAPWAPRGRGACRRHV